MHRIQSSQVCISTSLRSNSGITHSMPTQRSPMDPTASLHYQNIFQHIFSPTEASPTPRLATGHTII